ncbi:MAG: response regulator [Campylobacterales bacterium]|nr:response regulator [Campylobacterales bacterium]
MKQEKNFIFDKIKCNILIVDDSKTINNVLTKKFQTNGYTTFNAYTLFEAREIIKQNEIHYLILDINLPDGKGYDLLDDLKDYSIKVFI